MASYPLRWEQPSLFAGDMERKRVIRGTKRSIKRENETFVKKESEENEQKEIF